MPSAKKVSWAQLRVGITAIVAMSLTGVLIYLLTGTRSIFSRDAVLYTYMDDAAAVAVGAPVRINGINAGRVGKVGLSGLKDEGKIIRVDMLVEEKMLQHIPVDSVATVSAENLLGSKFINIKKGVSARTLKPGDTVPSRESKEIFEVMDSFFPLLSSAQGILKRVDAIVATVEAGEGSIGKILVDEELYNRANALLNEFQKSAAAINSGKGTMGRLLYDDDLYQEVRTPIQRMDRMLARLEAGEGTAGKLLRDPAVYNELERSLLEMRRIIEDLNAGKGSAGKLLKSDETHKQITALLAKMDLTMEKLNTGQGTLGQLLINPQLYQSLDGATREMNGLLKDFRANPKKFLRIKLALF